MSEKNRGKIVPFALSASRMRRGAMEHRRRGRPLEAVELLRHAAQTEDSSAGWLELAQELRRLGCYEQALAILYRLIPRADRAEEVWLELAMNQQALGQRDPAVDSLYHYLEEDPCSDTSDDVRDMLADLDGDEEERQALRLPALIRRALESWRAGRRDEAARRFRRAMRLSDNPAQLSVTLALLYLSGGDRESALREIARALRLDGAYPRALTVLSVILSAAGKRRAALGVLRKCAGLCDSPAQEESFLTAAWAVSAQAETERYLRLRLARLPFRVALIMPMASLLWRRGRYNQAQAFWRRALRLDPDNVTAASLLRFASAHPGGALPPEGMLPKGEVRARMMTLARAIAGEMPPDELLAPGSETRALTDWSFTIADEKLQTTLLEAVARADGEREKHYLRELLTCPTVLPAVREKALLALVQAGETGPVPMILGQRIGNAALKGTKNGGRSAWSTFLRLLLEETRAYRQASPLAFFAAQVWRQLTPAQRAAASGDDSYVFVKAVEILYLRRHGQEARAGDVARGLMISPRRVGRVLRGLERRLETPKGEA